MEKLGGTTLDFTDFGRRHQEIFGFSSMEKGIRVFRVCCGGSDREVENKVKV